MEFTSSSQKIEVFQSTTLDFFLFMSWKEMIQRPMESLLWLSFVFYETLMNIDELLTVLLRTK